MKKKRLRALEFLRGVLLGAVMLLFGLVAAQAETITMGKTIDKNNCQEYASLLTPSMLRAVQNGDWTYPTGNLKYTLKHWDRFISAGEKNAGKFDVNAKGWLIDKSTGKYPSYNVYGFPFPQIDPKDPDAGPKIMWDFMFMKYRIMGWSRQNITTWLRRNATEDIVKKSFSYNLFLQGRPPEQVITKNPKKLLYADLSNNTEPMDARGSNSMSWEYLDETDTTVFNYVPSIRRVRRGSGASRSDPVMGSELWADAQNGFSGKNITFNWKLVGERILLIPLTSLEKQQVREAADGSMPLAGLPKVKFGFQTPGWKGASWAFTNIVWVPRPVWIIEGMPKDPYYTFGKHIFYIDKETYMLTQKEYYDKAGKLWIWAVSVISSAEGQSGNNAVGYIITTSATDIKSSHATAVDMASTIFLPVTKLSPDFFSLNNFMQLSK